MNFLFQVLGIKIKTVGPYNHKSLQVEHGIKSLSAILTKHLTGQGQTWHKYLSLAAFAYNTFHSPNLGNYSPFELTLSREPKHSTKCGNRSRCKNFWYIQGLPHHINKETQISPKHTAKLQGEMHSSYKQGQGIFPV